MNDPRHAEEKRRRAEKTEAQRVLRDQWQSTHAHLLTESLIWAVQEGLNPAVEVDRAMVLAFDEGYREGQRDAQFEWRSE